MSTKVKQPPPQPPPAPPRERDKGGGTRATAARLKVRRGEFVHWRRSLLSHSWLWFVVMIVGATALVLPPRQRAYPQLSAGDIAHRDIVVERDVTLPDAGATEANRRRASLEVLPVYVFDSGAGTTFGNKLSRLAEAGRTARRGLSNTDLAALLAGASGLSVEPVEAAVLARTGFTPELEAVLREVVERIYRQGVVPDRGDLLASSDRGVVLRSPDGTERIELDVYRFLEGGAPLAEELDQRLASEAVPRTWRRPLAALLGRNVQPNVVLDRGETLARRLKAESGVEEVTVRLPRGRVLVRRGDEVTPQTARLLSALATRSASSTVLVSMLGAGLIVGLLAVAWYFYLRRESPSPEDRRLRFGAMAALTVLMLLLERGTAFLAGAVAGSVMRDPFGHVELYLPALPHATGPIIAGLMFGLPVGIVFAAVQAVLVGLMVSADAHVAAYALLSGVAAAFASQRMKERNVLARSAMVLAGINALAIAGLGLFEGAQSWPVLAVRIGAGATGGVLAAVLASFLLPVLESVTGSVTDIRLLELSNPNLPLLRRMASEAPGTFQHSLAMANLAEAAAESIGANPLLARVCCYYHDIGKLAKPDYFVENQRGGNPHDHLTPWMSALVVSNHVKSGLELARTYKLPEPVRDAIATHHGNKLIRYFYSRAKEQEGPDKGTVSDNEFRYPGPRPRTKEAGIIHLADSIEAASRTLQDPTPGRLQDMIDQIIKHALEDGQLDDCELTLKDVEKIGAAFFWVLTNAFHSRVEYPGFDFNRARRG